MSFLANSIEMGIPRVLHIKESVMIKRKLDFSYSYEFDSMCKSYGGILY
jgi:hypothetical protein